jgi:putative ABC transport system permease protein
VSGLSTNGTNIVNTTVFISLDQFAELLGPGANYVLVGAEPGETPEELADRISAELPDATVQTRAQFSRQESLIVRDMATDIMSIMTAIGFLIALAVVALTLFTVTLSKLREYGIIKAMGGTPLRMGGTVAAQALWTVLLATVVAVAAAYVLGGAIGALTPNVRVIIEPDSVIRTAAGAAIVGLVAAAMPLRRILAVDPASAFRRAS